MEIGTTYGSHRVDAKLGEGGMADVYKVWNTGLHRYEALKAPKLHFAHDPTFVSRFLTEARTAASLQHPHIATIHTVSDVQSSQPFFTMELVDGGDLASHIGHLGCFTVGEALPILRQIGEALDYAHAHGTIHRDVKPANVLLQQTGQGGWNVKVVDFGIARAQEPGSGARLTKTGMIIGTPEYMSPEQGGSGARIDHRTDVYSLGVIAYEMLCGHPPFSAGINSSAISVIISHIRDAPRPLVEQIPQIPSVVNDAILRALAKDPGARFSSCADFVNTLSGAVVASRNDASALQTDQTSFDQQHSHPSRSPRWVILTLIVAICLGGSMVAVSVARNQRSQGISVLAGTPHFPAPAAGLRPLVQVPKFVGKTEDQARTMAAASLLDLNVTTDHSASVPAGLVINQSLPPETSTSPSAKINVLISTGPSSSTPPPNTTSPHQTARVLPAPLSSSSNSTLSQSSSNGIESVEASDQNVSDRNISELRDRYNDWLQAWRRMNIETYMSFYSPQVIERRAGKPSYGYAEMRRKLADNWAKQSYVAIDSQIPDIRLQGNTAVISVTQHYDSTTWWDQGLKNMVWTRENGKWLIREESFTKQGGGPKR